MAKARALTDAEVVEKIRQRKAANDAKIATIDARIEAKELRLKEVRIESKARIAELETDLQRLRAEKLERPKENDTLITFLE